MAGKINVPVSVAVQGIANTTKQLSMLGKSISSIGKTAGLTALAYGAFAAGVKASDFAIQAIEGSRELERNLLGLKTVFETVTPQMRTFASTADNMGLSFNDAAKSSIFIGSVLKQSGFSISETADLTERLVKLGTDLSLTYGYDVQEALLGMTALFRGEYDPIEKFGVAMKQSEINSELAARGLNNLEGAARRFAEQQIRVELLFKRSQDAQGAFERGTGTLAVEQLKLAAAFGTIRDTVAVSMLPVLGNVFAELRDSALELEEPLRNAFEALAPAVENLAFVVLPIIRDSVLAIIDGFTQLAGYIEDIFDPTDQVNEGFRAILANIDALVYTLFGWMDQLGVTVDFAWLIARAFETVADFVADVIRAVDILLIIIQTIAYQAGLLFTGQWEKLANTDWSQQLEAQVAIRDGIVAQRLAAEALNFELDKSERIMREMRKNQEQTYNDSYAFLESIGAVTAKKAPRIVSSSGSDSAGGQAKNFVQDFFDGIRDEVAKQQARVKLENLGASEGLIDQILGSQGWQEVFDKVMKSGKRGIRDLQDQFNKTAGGIKELEAARAEAAKKAQEAAQLAAEKTQELVDAYEDAKAIIQEFKKELLAVSTIEILPTITRELGEFEQAVVSSFETIRENLAQGLVDGAILASDLAKLEAWASAEELALAAISKKRDELASRFDLAEALIAEYRTAFSSAMNLVSLFGQIEQRTREVTVTQVTQGTTSLGASLKDLQFTLTKSYTETVDEVTNKSEELVNNFRNMADKARSFAQNLRKLREMGLDPQLFQQLVQAGVEAGSETAQALVDGGAGTISEINTLFGEIDDLGASLGEEVATSLYGSGIDMANGLLEGIRSKQNEFEKLAREMAQGFKKTFDEAVGVATGRSEATAQMPVLQDQLDKVTSQVEFAQKRLSEEQAKLSKAKDKELRASIQKKIDSYTGQIASFTEQLNGINAQIGQATTALNAPMMLPATPMTAAGGQATVVNNYTVNVTADSRLSGAKAGEAVVQQLLAYQNANGSVNAVLVG